MNREQRRFLKKKSAAKKLTNLFFQVIDKLDLDDLISLQSYVNKKIEERSNY